MSKDFNSASGTGDWAATCRPLARPAGALLGAGAVWESERPEQLLHRPSDREQLRHRRQQLPGHRERVEQPQLLRQHAGLQGGLRCESSTKYLVNTMHGLSFNVCVCVCV